MLPKAVGRCRTKKERKEMTEKEQEIKKERIVDALKAAEEAESTALAILIGPSRGKQWKKETESYLKGYAFCKRLLNLKNHEKKYPETLEWERGFPSEMSLAKAKMFEIRHFILSLPNSNEKMLLYFHYIRGDSVEKCGELLGVSRATAFRLHDRALRTAYTKSIEINFPLIPACQSPTTKLSDIDNDIPPCGRNKFTFGI